MQLFIKNIAIVITLVHLLLLSTSCKKENENAVNLQVIEYKTNAPVAGALLAFRNSGSFDRFCSCFPPETFFSAQTDATGGFSVSPATFNKAAVGIFVSKNGYWPATFFVPQTKYELDLVSQVTVHLINIKTYPGNSIMELSSVGERATSVGFGTPSFSLPADSTVVSDAFGGQSNTIWWRVYSATFTPVDSGFQKIDVARSGTTPVEIQY